jgi:excisionase family DNA binding protein
MPLELAENPTVRHTTAWRRFPMDSESRLLLTVEEAANQIRVGRTTMYALLRDGAIESVLIGKKRRVPVVALRAYVDRLVAGDAA